MEPNSHSIRVLVRPPPAPTQPLPPQPPPPSPPDPSLPPKNGVVVVGFIGRRHHDVSHLINKIIDSKIFGSGSLDTPFRFEPDKINPETRKWFESRKLSFYHDEEQRILYLQFSSVRCPATEEGLSETRFESVMEEQEFGDLQGLLFMFSLICLSVTEMKPCLDLVHPRRKESFGIAKNYAVDSLLKLNEVCHIIILIQEGSRFDTQMLKKFRVLQAAKHTMAPFIRSQNMSHATSRPRSSAHSRISPTGASPKNPSPGKSRGILNRNASSITVMSGLGSYTSLLPGQCTPVILFVFLDDFSEIHSSGNIEETSETASLNLSPNLNSSGRPGLPTKGSSSVVVLARPVNKSEGGLRKKLQSSLEAQIRFSIKKCRTLSDAGLSQSGESLEFAISLVEEVLDGKATPDSLLLESHQQNANKEDILSVKEFIYRQSDLLRGRGGLAANSNSGSAPGVGMAAAAAAAAAASASASASAAASGKTVTAPELPTLEIWSSSSQLILHGILSAKRACTYETKINRMREQDTASPTGENTATPSDPFESAVSHLENGIGLNTRFSTLWCQKAFPVAKAVYLDDLPPCYPSSQHEDHLRKALCALTSMVKGPAVQLYMKKLKDECTSIWSSGRQLCDAVSLTGKPCMHQKHDTQSLTADDIKPHSSGYVYLHACACGRSRRLRPDPFDYETANGACNSFADCDKLLPAVQMPEGSIKGPIKPSSWNLIRIGGARYYDPSKGLLQSGFNATQKFLLRWTIFVEKLKEATHSLLNNSQQGVSDRTIRVETVIDANRQTSDASLLGTGGAQNGVGMQIRLSSDITGNTSKSISVGRGLSNFTMRKPFSEVVAGPAAANSGFPPLLSRKQPLPDIEKGVKQHHEPQQAVDKLSEIVYNQESKKVENIASIDNASNDNGIASNTYKYGNLFPHFGSNIVPLNTNSIEQIKAASVKRMTIYMGFEHECPRGHRFILTPDHLNDLGPSYLVPEENAVPLLVENLDKKQDAAKFGKIGGHGRTRRGSNGIIMAGGSSKSRNTEKSKEKVANGNTSSKSMQSTRQGKDQNERTKVTDFVKDLDADLRPTVVDDGGGAFSLLNRNNVLLMVRISFSPVPRVGSSILSTVNSWSTRIAISTPPGFYSFPFYEFEMVFYAKLACIKCGKCRVFILGQFLAFSSSTISFYVKIQSYTGLHSYMLCIHLMIDKLSCLPPSVPDREQKLRFSLGCPVILPPESFLSLRLPFVYGVELEDGSLHSLRPFENQPQLTAYIMKGTALQEVESSPCASGKLFLVSKQVASLEDIAAFDSVIYREIESNWNVFRRASSCCASGRLLASDVAMSGLWRKRLPSTRPLLLELSPHKLMNGTSAMQRTSKKDSLRSTMN
ncbi:protein SMG8 [Sesamum angolense]|uniref:Nonsense-mediated mRNA decay factor SMG8 n=1 Tax=Sesamum angolense TaxID=2727404 RepID=A0AAE1XBY7_9LAMI|nr:protein SMG8 [Sesamum angolense]